jgi:Tfp pilus assembly protein PilN
MSDLSSKTPVSADAEAFAKARGDAPATQAATPRLRRDESQTSRRERRQMIPAASSFDLLGGEYVRARKTRIFSFMSLAATGLVVMLLLGQFVRVKLETSAQQSAAQAASDRATKVLSQMDALTQFDGIPGDAVATALTNRTAQAAAATESELDLAQAFEDIANAVPDGVQLTGIELDVPAVFESTEENKRNGTAGKSTGFLTLTVLADVANYDAISPFLDGLRAVPYLADFNETWDGQPPRISLRIAIQVPTASTARYVEFASEAGLVGTSSGSDTATATDGGS